MNKLKVMKQYLVDRASEPSTITAVAGVTVYFTNKYYQFSDETTLTTIISIIFGAVLTGTKEQKKL